MGEHLSGREELNGSRVTDYGLLIIDIKHVLKRDDSSAPRLSSTFCQGRENVMLRVGV